MYFQVSAGADSLFPVFLDERLQEVRNTLIDSRQLPHQAVSRFYKNMTATFEAMALATPLKQVLNELDYTTPSPVQAQAIPLLLEGRDLLGCAQTGTGKTASFALPILNKLHTDPRPVRSKQCRCLVLAPTRELAGQVAKSFSTYGEKVRFRLTTIWGGVGQRPQVNAMRSGVDVLVATPGRLLDLIDQGHVDLSAVDFFVLDEVDRMLDMGFLRDVKRIVALLPREKQSLFFSATLAPNIVSLAQNILRNPARVSITPEVTTAERIDQKLCFVDRGNKMYLLQQLLEKQSQAKEAKLTIVFGRTKHGSNKLAKALTAAGVAHEYLAFGGYASQWRRRNALKMWTGWPTFPMVFVSGMLLGGAQELQQRIASGELKGLLAP